MSTLGNFSVIRLKKPIECDGFIIGKGSVGVTCFVPYSGIGVKFETKFMKPTKGYPIINLNDLQENKDYEYVIKSITVTYEVRHINDEVEV